MSAKTTAVSVADLPTRLTKALQGRYRITKMVGRGGMGAVFLAEDLTLERPVAIKALPLEVSHDEKLIGRFEREARTAARLDHPNIIPIFSVDSADGLHFFVMKFVDGDNLDQLMESGRLPIARTQGLLWEAAVALGHAHQRGVVHRDIKPANIMLDHDGRVIITDFGISKAMQSSTQLTGTGQVIGTPHYMSPEQAKGGDLDGRSDQYSLAVLAYQMVTGRVPFPGEAVHAVIYQHLSQDPVPIAQANPEVPKYLADAIHRGLAKNPNERFPTMEEFAHALLPDRRVSVPTAAVRRSMASRPSRGSMAVTELADARPVIRHRSGRKKKHGWGRAVAALFVIGGLGGGGFWAWGQGHLAALGVPAPLWMAVDSASTADSVATLATQPLAASGDSTPADSGLTDPSVQTPRETTDTQAAVPETEPEPEPRPVRRPPRRRPVVETPVEPEGPEMGLVTIGTQRYPGRVYIDDRHVGDIPVVNHSLTIGSHVIRITYRGCEDIIDTVFVEAGRTDAQRIKKAFVKCGGGA